MTGRKEVEVKWIATQDQLVNVLIDIYLSDCQSQ